MDYRVITSKNIDQIFAAEVLKTAHNEISKKGFFSIGIPGGSTPEDFLNIFATSDIDFSNENIIYIENSRE